jgi:hypothetical protein
MTERLIKVFLRNGNGRHNPADPVPSVEIVRVGR